MQQVSLKVTDTRHVALTDKAISFWNIDLHLRVSW